MGVKTTGVFARVTKGHPVKHSVCSTLQYYSCSAVPLQVSTRAGNWAWRFKNTHRDRQKETWTRVTLDTRKPTRAAYIVLWPHAFVSAQHLVIAASTDDDLEPDLGSVESASIAKQNGLMFPPN